MEILTHFPSFGNGAALSVKYRALSLCCTRAAKSCNLLGIAGQSVLHGVPQTFYASFRLGSEREDLAYAQFFQPLPEAAQRPLRSLLFLLLG